MANSSGPQGVAGLLTGLGPVGRDTYHEAGGQHKDFDPRTDPITEALRYHPSQPGIGPGDGCGVALIRNGKPLLIRREGEPDYGPKRTHTNTGGAGCEVIRAGDPRFLIPTQGQGVLAQGVPFDPMRYMTGRWKYGLYRPDNKGVMQLVHEGETPNTIVDAGKLAILNTMFNSGTQIVQTNWYAGLIDVGSYGGINPADTIASHTGWLEFTSYSQTNRPGWAPGAPTNVGGVSITNSSPITFNIAGLGAPTSVKGLFINGGGAGSNTKGGTTGTLWAATLFVGGDVPVQNVDELRCTYTVNM